MPADSDASHAVKGSVKQGEGESDNYIDDEAPKRLPNELLDKIINFALTGTELLLSLLLVLFVSSVIALNVSQVVISVASHESVTATGHSK